MSSRNIRRDAFEKLARLSAQSPTSKTTSPDLAKLYKRCPSEVVGHNGTSAVDGVPIASIRMVRSL